MAKTKFSIENDVGGKKFCIIATFYRWRASNLQKMQDTKKSGIEPGR